MGFRIQNHLLRLQCSSYATRAVLRPADLPAWQHQVTMHSRLLAMLGGAAYGVMLSRRCIKLTAMQELGVCKQHIVQLVSRDTERRSGPSLGEYWSPVRVACHALRVTGSLQVVFRVDTRSP